MATTNGSSGNDTIDGTSDADSLSGQDGNDTLRGVGGDDTLRGGNGSDVLEGGSGFDFLDGGAGNDQLFGNAGPDFLIGGSGNDTLDGGTMLDLLAFSDINCVSFASSSAPVAVTLTSGSGTAQDGLGGTDTLINIQWVIGTSFNDTLTGSNALVFEVFEGGAGNDSIDGGALSDPLSRNSNRVNYVGLSQPVTVDLQAGTASGGGGNDTLININFVAATAFADTLRGSDPPNVFEQFAPGAGNDTVDGRGGLDVLRYDLTGATGGVVVDLLSGTASDGQGGTDSFSNIEGVFASAFADQLFGSNRTDQIEYFMGRGGADSIDGRGGFDVVLYSFAPGPVSVQFNALSPGSAIDGEAGATSDLLQNIEGVYGSAFNDTLVGSNSARAELFEGAAGNDSIDGGLGDEDEVTYERAYNNGVDVSLGGSGASEDGFGGTDFLVNIEHVTGSLLYDDYLEGDDRNNRLSGLGGNDDLAGMLGDDTLLGGDGDDNFLPGEGVDLVDGGAGNDVLYAGKAAVADYVVRLVAPDVLHLQNAAAHQSITLRGVETVVFTDGPRSFASLIGDLTVQAPTALADTLVGSPDNDSIDALDGDDEVYGGVGDDRLTGGPGNDSLEGQSGNDTLTGGIGSDLLRGGTGNDSISAGDPEGGHADDAPGGADRLYGELGNDTLEGDSQDTLVGGPGNDQFVAMSTTNVSYEDDPGPVVVLLSQTQLQTGTATDGYGGNDQFLGVHAAVVGSAFADQFTGASVTGLPAEMAWTNNDDLRGMAGNDTLRGLLGDDTLGGGDGNDVIEGGAGYDALFGGAGDDSISGGADSDLLAPGAGNDTLDGGEGSDTADYSGLETTVQVNLATGRTTKSLGNDTLIGIEGAWGTSGADQFTGDSGSNRFRGLGGNDTFEASGGIDVLDYDDFTLAEGVGVVVTLPSGLIAGTAQDGHGGIDTIRLGSAEQVIGSGGPDSITGAEDTIVNEVQHGNDSIWGGWGRDTLLGLSGNDSLFGGGDDDSIVGGDGDDMLCGDSGDDTLVPGTGDDTVEGDEGNDTVVLGFQRADATVIRLGNDLLLNRTNGDTVLLRGIEQAQFSDGTVAIGALISSSGGTLVASYSFNDTLAANEPGKPALVSVDPGLVNTFETAVVNGVSQRVFSWDGDIAPEAQGGLTLNATGLLSYNNYSIELVFRFSQAGDGSWQRIADMHNRQSDIGFYVDSDGLLNAYPDAEGSTVFSPGVFHTVVLSNLVINGTRQVRAYLDGHLELESNTDQFNLDNTDNPGRMLVFFLDNIADDPQDEWSAGSIASLKLYDGIVVPLLTPTLSAVTDDAGSSIGPLAAGARTDDSRPTLSGSATAGQTVIVFDGATELGRVVADGQGQWSFTTATLSEGQHALSVRALDITFGTQSGPSAPFAFVVDAINVAPRSADASASLQEDGQASGSLPAASDDDGDSVTFSLGQTAAHGVAVVNANGSWQYTPQANYNGSDSFGFSVSDVRGGSNSYTVTLTVTPVNDAPSGSLAVAGTAEVGQLLTLQNTLADVDGLGPFNVQWLRGGSAIAGATQSSYTVRDSDIGATLSARVSWTDGGGTVETVTSAATAAVVGGSVVTGTSGNDVLAGTAGNDTLRGLDGDDTLSAGAGNDLLQGGAGYDVLQGGAGNDTLDGGGDGDVARYGGDTALVVDVGAGTVTLGSEVDTLISIEAIFGSSAADLMSGANEADNLRGQTLRGGAGNDTLDGRGGVDVAEFTGTRSQYTVTRANLGSLDITVRDNVGSNGDEGADTLRNIERLVFGDQMLAFGTRAEELARVAVVLWGPAIIGSAALFSRGLSFYDVGYSFTQMSQVALQFWGELNDTQLAQRLIDNSHTSKTAAQLLATMASQGNGDAGRAAAVREAALDAATTITIEASGIRSNGLVADLFVPDFGQLFQLLPGG